MSSPQVSIVITSGDAAHRLRLSLMSAIVAGNVCGAPFEIIIALADADAPTREVAEAMEHPRLRLSPASAATTRAAARLAWGETVVLLKGGDLLSPTYVACLVRRLSEADGADVIARPSTCVTYGGSPSMRLQASLGGGANDRGRLLFAAPFAPALAAARSLLARLPPRYWSVDDDWAWTARTSAEGVRHEVVDESVYVAWSPPAATPIALPPVGEAPAPVAPSSLTPSVKPASEAEVAALLYARAAQARIAGVEASLSVNDHRLAVLKEQANGLHLALAEALGEADEARHIAESLQASTSWKVTAPLRALVSLVKPGGGR